MPGRRPARLKWPRTPLNIECRGNQRQPAGSYRSRDAGKRRNRRSTDDARTGLPDHHGNRARRGRRALRRRGRRAGRLFHAGLHRQLDQYPLQRNLDRSAGHHLARDGYFQSRTRGISQRPLVADVRARCDRRLGQLRNPAADQRPDQERTRHVAAIRSAPIGPISARAAARRSMGWIIASTSSQSKIASFIDGDYQNLSNFSTQLNYRVTRLVQGIRSRRVQERCRSCLLGNAAGPDLFRRVLRQKRRGLGHGGQYLRRQHPWAADGGFADPDHQLQRCRQFHRCAATLAARRIRMGAQQRHHDQEPGLRFQRPTTLVSTARPTPSTSTPRPSIAIASSSRTINMCSATTPT